MLERQERRAVEPARAASAARRHALPLAVGAASLVYATLVVTVASRSAGADTGADLWLQLTVVVLVCAAQTVALTARARRPAWCFLPTLAGTCVLMVVTSSRTGSVTPAYLAAIVALGLHAQPALRTTLAVTGVLVEAAVQFGLLLQHDLITVQDTYAFAGPLLNIVLTYVVCMSVGQLVAQHRLRQRQMLDELARSRHEQERATVDAVEAERHRMARELHDVAAHHLTTVVVQGRLALSHDDPTLRDAALEAVVTHGRRALTSLRHTVTILRTDASETPPVHSLDTVGELLKGLEHALGAARLATEGDLRSLPDAVQLAGYRIVQESVSNVARHAPLSDVEVVVRRTVDALTLEITNGPPRNPGTGGGQRLGLTGMHERVALVGGSLEAGPTVAGGWRVRAHLPAPPEMESP